MEWWSILCCWLLLIAFFVFGWWRLHQGPTITMKGDDLKVGNKRRRGK